MLISLFVVLGGWAADGQTPSWYPDAPKRSGEKVPECHWNDLQNNWGLYLQSEIRYWKHKLAAFNLSSLPERKVTSKESLVGASWVCACVIRAPYLFMQSRWSAGIRSTSTCSWQPGISSECLWLLTVNNCFLRLLWPTASHCSLT